MDPEMNNTNNNQKSEGEFASNLPEQENMGGNNNKGKIALILILVLILGFVAFRMISKRLGSDGVSIGDQINITPGSGGDSIDPISTDEYANAEAKVTLPFFNRSDDDFNISNTYYVAINEPGASNTNCDGLAPTNEGNGRCPFKDFSSQSVRDKLKNVSGTRMYVREGYYPIEKMGSGNETGIQIQGTGDEFKPVILSGYPNETATLDAGETFERADKLIAQRGGQLTEDDINIRQIISMDGQYEIVEGLTIKNGWRHNVLAAGPYNIIRNNILIGAFEDSIKVTHEADYGYIFGNDISGYSSQAVDYFGIDNWLIKNNNIHHPNVDPVTREGNANGIGGKGGFTNLVIVGNKIHDFDSANQVPAAIVMGGTGDSSAFNKDFLGRVKPSATSMIAINNTIYNYKGPAVHFQYCENCVFASNTIYSTLGAFAIGLQPSQDFPELPDTKNAVIKNNIFAGNQGDLENTCTESGFKIGDTCYVHFIYGLDATEGLVSENNTYYSNTEPKFAVFEKDGPKILNHSEFQSRMGVDSSSQILPFNQFQAR
jgi:hypothetical protein